MREKCRNVCMLARHNTIPWTLYMFWDTCYHCVFRLMNFCKYGWKSRVWFHHLRRKFELQIAQVYKYYRIYRGFVNCFKFKLSRSKHKRSVWKIRVILCNLSLCITIVLLSGCTCFHISNTDIIISLWTPRNIEKIRFCIFLHHKNMARHTAHIIVSWPTIKQ